VIVYGVALLGFCMLAGVFAGEMLGKLVGVQANVGGVGIAMLLLMLLTNLGGEKNLTQLRLGDLSEAGIGFWSAMYIPIVVAMAAKQNVIAALDGGAMALVAGVAAVVASFALIPVLSRFGRRSTGPTENKPRQ